MWFILELSIVRKFVSNLWSSSDPASANECLANVSWRHSNSYRGYRKGNCRGSSYSSPSRGASRGGCQRGSSVALGGMQPQSSSQQDQQTQFQYVISQSDGSQGSRCVQTNDSRRQGGVFVDRNSCRRCGGAGHWQNSCPSPPSAQTHLCFRLRTDKEFAGISSGDVNDLRLVEGKMGT